MPLRTELTKSHAVGMTEHACSRTWEEGSVTLDWLTSRSLNFFKVLRSEHHNMKTINELPSATERQKSVDQRTEQANKRCNQENVIEQQKNGVHAFQAPLDNLTSNWAYMVITSLAWSLKAWSALLVPVSPRWRVRHEAEKQKLLRMEFPTFRQAMINIPAQIIRGSRRLIYRLLSWNQWQPTFFRLWDQLQRPLRC